MTLALLVYLVSVIPSIGLALWIAAILTCFGFGLMLLFSVITFSVYGDYGDEHKEVIRAKTMQKHLRNKLWIPITLVFVATLIPDKTTLYTMIAAYAGQKIAETPAAQQIGNDAVDVLHELLAKAKRELKDDVKEESKK